MDFITERFERQIKLSQSGSTDKSSLLQARIEYLFYFMLGYLWNKRRDDLGKDELSNFVKSLNGKLTVGSILHTIKIFDKDGEFIDGKRSDEISRKYLNYRNDYIGHGYVFADGAQESEKISRNERI